MNNENDVNEMLKVLNEGSLANIHCLYKALIAYSLGFEGNLSQEDEYKLDKVLEFYYDNDYLTNFVSQDIVDKAKEIFDID